MKPAIRGQYSRGKRSRNGPAQQQWGCGGYGHSVSVHCSAFRLLGRLSCARMQAARDRVHPRLRHLHLGELRLGHEVAFGEEASVDTAEVSYMTLRCHASGSSQVMALDGGKGAARQQ